MEKTNTDAARRAKLKYRREKVKKVVLELSPAEEDMRIHLDSKVGGEGKATYIKRLIRQDMPSK